MGPGSGASELLHLLCDVPVSDVDLEYAGIERARLGRVALGLGDRAKIIQDLPGALSGLGNLLQGAGVLVLGQVEEALLLPATGQQATGFGGQPGVLDCLLELGSRFVVGFLSQEGLPQLEPEVGVPGGQLDTGSQISHLKIPKFSLQPIRLGRVSLLVRPGDGLLERLASEGRDLGGKVYRVLAVGERPLQEVESCLGIPELLVDSGHLDHEVDVGRILRKAILEPGQLLAKLFGAQLDSFLSLNAGGLLAVDHLLPAVGNLVVTRRGQCLLGSEVLACLECISIPGVRLERTLVVLKGTRHIALHPHHRARVLEPFGIAGCNLGEKLEDGQGGLVVLLVLQADPEQEVRLLVGRVGLQVGLEGLDGSSVLTGLDHALGNGEGPGALELAEQLPAPLLLMALQERAPEASTRLSHVRIDIQKLLIQLHGEVVVSPARGFFRLLDVLGVIDQGRGGSVCARVWPPAAPAAPGESTRTIRPWGADESRAGKYYRGPRERSIGPHPPMSEPLEFTLTRYPEPVLRKVASPVEAFDEELRQTVDAMYQLMFRSSGVGLAAPQVGLKKRILVLNSEGDSKKPELNLTLVNPRIVDRTGNPTRFDEGCLSFPGIYAEIERPDRCTVEAFDIEGNELQEEYSGFISRIIQHEYDHLEGILLVDRMSPADKTRNRAALDELIHEYKTARARG